MLTFAQLLTEYMARTGISDVELARTLGTSRQTIFRWKQGLTGRPRHREDVLRCAARLRLAPEERDALLMAAGFAPEEPPSPKPALQSQSPVTVPRDDGRIWVIPRPAGAASRLSPPATHRPRPAGNGAADRTAGGAAAGAREWNARPAPAVAPRRIRRAWRMPPLAEHRWTWPALAAALLVVALGAWMLLRGSPLTTRYPQAEAGEALVLVARFANYAGDRQGYNVADRLREALEQEITAGQVTGMRVAAWPAEVKDAAGAAQALARSGAAMMVWGEYDSGRVVSRFTTARAGDPTLQLSQLMASSVDLPVTINSLQPEEVRHIALLSLGQLDLAHGQPERARAILAQAMAAPPSGADALAALHFWLGYAYQQSPGADLDESIQYYSDALAAQPATLPALNNRAIAYMQRGYGGDLDHAVADLTQALAAAPEDFVMLNNRGAVYLQRDADGDLDAALADLDRAITLAPGTPETYYNRGLLYVRKNETARWEADLQEALRLSPSHAGALNALCWAYALDRQPSLALGYCHAAVQRDPAGPAHDSRGIVYAELGRTKDAIDEFQYFVDWADHEPPQSPYRAQIRLRRAWIEALQAGNDPFDDAMLARLRAE